MKELDEIHSANELSVMDMFHSIEKTVERMEDSCRFTERILEHGNGVEVLSLKKHISIQLLMLLNNIPRPEPSVKIEFHTDTDKFGAMMKMAFGRFKRPDELNRVSITMVNCSSIDHYYYICASAHPVVGARGIMFLDCLFVHAYVHRCIHALVRQCLGRGII